MIRAATIALCLTIASGALAQEAGVVQAIAVRPAGGMVTMNIGANPNMRVPPAVTGMPYSAQQVSETVQTLADGTHIKQNTRTVVMYRDSLGRTRTETPAFGPVNNGAKLVRIVDVVGGYEYTLDDTNHIAHRVIIQVAQPIARRAPGTLGNGSQLASRTAPLPATLPPGVAGRPHPEMQSEDLGMQVIEGVNAKGRRTTQTWPVDSVGNDRPIVSVHETWFCDQLGGMMVLSKSTDPRYGETTTALKDLNLSEPDPALFQPPAGYQIEDETGPFKITVPQNAVPQH
jgi:hypothetical protein